MGNIILLKELNKKDVEDVGEKALNLAKLHANKFPIPISFVISYSAYQDFLLDNDLSKHINNYFSSISLDNFSSIGDVSSKLRELIVQSDLSNNLKKEISEAYSHLEVHQDIFKANVPEALSFIKAGRSKPFVAVKRSGNFDFKENFNVLNVIGETNVLDAIKQCWSSFFSRDLVSYIIKNNLSSHGVCMAIIIQKMVNSDKSGIIYSRNQDHENEIKIEAGLGMESKVKDEYILDRDSLELKQKVIVEQEEIMYRDDNVNKIVRKYLNNDKGKQQKLNVAELKKLGLMAKRVESLLEKPQQINFGIEFGRVYLLSSKSLKKPENGGLEPKQTFF